jgi:hypothetical protein
MAKATTCKAFSLAIHTLSVLVLMFQVSTFDSQLASNIGCLEFVELLLIARVIAARFTDGVATEFFQERSG